VLAQVAVVGERGCSCVSWERRLASQGHYPVTLRACKIPGGMARRPLTELTTPLPQAPNLPQPHQHPPRFCMLPTDAGLAATAARTPKPGKLNADLAE
jgi:hypothetical protein